MTTNELKQLFVKYEDEFLKFEKIEAPYSRRPDLTAFVLLDLLVPGKNDIIASSHHDEIYLAIDVEELAAEVKEDEVLDLVRCGVRYDTQYDSLCMFV